MCGLLEVKRRCYINLELSDNGKEIRVKNRIRMKR